VSLPEIPDGAIDAVLAVNRPGFEPGFTRPPAWVVDEIRVDLAAAWPHLYAAALRHAAEEIDRDFRVNVIGEAISDAGDKYLNTLRRMSWRDVLHLRRLADEADPQP
jgi:hypothetical protein